MKEDVRELAKKIMDEFISALNKVEQTTPEFGVRRIENIREPFENKYKDSDFRQRMFRNAPHTDGEFILAEKKKW